MKKLVSREDEFFILRKFIKKKENVIDVGANIEDTLLSFPI